MRMTLPPRLHSWRAGLAGLALAVSPVLSARAEFWTTAYYPGWEQSGMPASNIDFTVVTHLIHFSLVPNTDGSLNSSANGVTASRSSDAVSRAHAAGRAVLICVGGADSEAGFQGAASAANRAAFVSNLTNFVAARGYDGLDVDWEPLPASDFDLFTNFVKAVRAALNGFPSHKLLTAAAGAYPSYGDPPASQYVMFAGLQSQFDQINVMTYDLAGPYPGWVTWFNSPLYDGGFRFPSTGGLVPSSDGAIANFLANGVAAAKLGLGVAFYGDIWTHGAGTSTGGTLLPRQTWTTAPTTSQIAYSSVMSTYYQSNSYHWDTAAQAAYLGITNAIATNDMFISYDDDHTCQAKVSYARNHFLGGLMIWEVAQAYFPARPVGQRNPLLQTIKQGLATPGTTAIRRSGPDVELSFPALPLGSYRVLYRTNLALGSWLTLSNNVPGTDGVVQVLDPGAAAGDSARFYRVQTPP